MIYFCKKTGFRRQEVCSRDSISSFAELRWLAFGLVALVLAISGCQKPAQYRAEADEVALDIIEETQQQSLGRTEPFIIERAADILRRRLLTDQNLTITSESSLGTDTLSPIEHWPEPDYPKAIAKSDPNIVTVTKETVKISMLDALQIGAQNSFDYQTSKENVFRKALALDLERNDFRNIFNTQLESLISTDSTSGNSVSGTNNSGSAGASRKLDGGTELTVDIAVDLVKLMTASGASAMGITGDASISIPLLRGSGRHIVTEPLTQAQRNVVYSIYEFERFKRTFAVEVASDYLGVLRQYDQVVNNAESYRRLIASARRARRLANANMLREIQVDQAVQDELRARERWISATESYKKGLDSFKVLLGLPTDTKIELDRGDFDRLTERAKTYLTTVNEDETGNDEEVPPADAKIELIPPNYDNAGPLEMDKKAAAELALGNRLDLRVAEGKVYDAQRAVVIASDNLRAELTLLGSASMGASRSVATATSEDAKLRTNRGKYSGLLTLDLPIERTEERNAYRNSFITLEKIVRDFQKLEDSIKLSVRNELRDMLQARESLEIQTKSVFVAQKRVKSINMFLEAGRAEIRDLLEAEESLLSAQNQLTAAVVNYRIAELQIQRDMGLLMVDSKGLWKEYSPEILNGSPE